MKRSAVLFFVSTRLTDLQSVFCFKKIDQLRMLLHHDFSTIFIVCFSIVYRTVTIFDCRHVLLGGNVPSSTLNARCPATGTDESAEEDHPYTSPTRKLEASKSSLGRRHCVEVCPTRMLDHPYSFCRVASRGDPQEVINLGLAGLDSKIEIVSRLSSSTRNLFSLPLA